MSVDEMTTTNAGGVKPRLRKRALDHPLLSDNATQDY